MAKLRALEHVARTLATMFVSRNNDVDGYWAIGRLYRIAIADGRTPLELNLLASADDVHQVGDLRIVRQHYANVLLMQLRHAGVGAVPFKVAVIRVHFALSRQQPARFDASYGTYYGDPVECIVELETEVGHACRASARTRAAPHDATREQQRLDAHAVRLDSTHLAPIAASSVGSFTER